jgi:hypothetical protein
MANFIKQAVALDTELSPPMNGSFVPHRLHLDPDWGVISSLRCENWQL